MILDYALQNAMVVVPLALLALVAGRFAKSTPSFVHLVWLLVILKLLTPPVYEWSWPTAMGEEASPEEIVLDDGAILSPSDMELLALDAEGLRAMALAELEAEAEAEAEAEVVAPSVVSAQEASFPWRTLFVVLWLSGSCGIAALTIFRTRRFRHLLAQAEAPSRDLRRRATRLGRKIGLDRLPRIAVVNARISPMLWGFGRGTTLVLPSALDEELDRAEIETLLTHELAHFRRRDHWVRAIELLAVLLYWWHPVLWLARRELRRSEEECCDAWVLETLPESGGTYARALLNCIDFLAGERRPVAPAASGLGPAEVMKRRVHMILNQSAAARPTTRVRLAIVAMALIVLPLAPAIGQSADEKNHWVLLKASEGSEPIEDHNETSVVERLKRIASKLSHLAEGHPKIQHEVLELQRTINSVEMSIERDRLRMEVERMRSQLVLERMMMKLEMDKKRVQLERDLSDRNLQREAANKDSRNRDRLLNEERDQARMMAEEKRRLELDRVRLALEEERARAEVERADLRERYKSLQKKLERSTNRATISRDRQRLNMLSSRAAALMAKKNAAEQEAAHLMRLADRARLNLDRAAASKNPKEQAAQQELANELSVLEAHLADVQARSAALQSETHEIEARIARSIKRDPRQIDGTKKRDPRQIDATRPKSDEGKSRRWKISDKKKDPILWETGDDKPKKNRFELESRR